MALEWAFQGLLDLAFVPSRVFTTCRPGAGLPMAQRANPTRKVSRLRNRFFGHSLCDALGCPHRPAALVQRWRLWVDDHARWHRLREPAEPNQKCRNWLQGSRPDARTRYALMAEFPQLQAVFDNPLWAVLSAIEAGGSTESFKDRFQLNGGEIGRYSDPLIRQIAGSPHWDRFGFMLARMFAADISLYGMWARLNFSSYFKVAALRSPLCFLRAESFNVLSYLFDGSGQTVVRWPENLDELSASMEHFEKIESLVLRQGWGKAVDGDCYELIWQLLLKQNEEILRSLDEAESASRPLSFPIGLKRRVRAALKLQHNTHWSFH